MPCQARLFALVPSGLAFGHLLGHLPIDSLAPCFGELPGILPNHPPGG